MERRRLLPKAPVILTLNALYSAAEALCSTFISVYLWINSLDFNVVCRYYLALFAVTPVFFLLAGWYSQARDRLHVYRLGLVLHAVFYGTLLTLREQSPAYAGWLGALLGVTWGIYWAGANTFTFDVTAQGRREYFFGLLSGITGLVSLMAPIISGLIIRNASEPLLGYHIVFAVVLSLYLVSLALSFLVPSDNVRRPFRIRRALFPGKDQRDWRLMMWASISLSGSFNIFPFLLSLLMYLETKNELSVGGFASFQALAGVVVSFFVGRVVVARTRRIFMWWGVTTLLMAGATMMFPISILTLALFGLLRSVSGPLFGIPHSGLRLDIIANSAEEPAQRIEYLCAWEVPLAIGRVIMMVTLMAVYSMLSGSDVAARVMLFAMCAIRIATYQFVTHTSPMQAAAPVAARIASSE